MRTFLRWAILAALTAGIPLKAGAASSGADFLLLQPGARAVAAGGAFVSVSGTLQALTYNPACLVGLAGLQASLSHIIALGDWSHDWAAMAFPAGDFTLAVELQSDRLDSFTLYDSQGEAAGNLQAGSTLAGVTVALKWPGTGLALGISERFFMSQLAEYSNSGYSMSLGAGYSFPWVPLSLGAALQNLGEQTAFYQDKDPLPECLRLGMAWEAYASRRVAYRLLADQVVMLDPGRPSESRLGVEGFFLKHLRINGGFDLERDGVRMTAGAGYEVGFFRVFYAFIPGHMLGLEQRVSLEFAERHL